MGSIYLDGFNGNSHPNAIEAGLHRNKLLAARLIPSHSGICHQLRTRVARVQNRSTVVNANGRAAGDQYGRVTLAIDLLRFPTAAAPLADLRCNIFNLVRSHDYIRVDFEK